MKRISRNEYFMKIAEVTAKRSTCNKVKVGSILVNAENNQIVATGYNGSVKGAPHCIDEKCLMYKGHCIRTIHAETNAVLHLEKRYNKLILYTTLQPCINCYKLLLTANVKTIYYKHEYKDAARDMLYEELTEGFLVLPEMEMRTI